LVSGARLLLARFRRPVPRPFLHLDFAATQIGLERFGEPFRARV
jgi:hypothetical protein